jgi:beta-glucosidase
VEKNIKELISQLTLEEKADLCTGASFWRTHGIERLGIPPIILTDGPHGVRKQAGNVDHLGLNESEPATCFPSAVGLASSWNRELLRTVGEALGQEAQAEDVGILLGPGANIKRSPLCGRNFEYFSEDPYLTGELAASYIEGVQSQGVGTSLKHFAVNNQEYRRMTTDAVVDERTLREIYLTGFEKAVKQAQPWTVMSSYNRINGTYASENEILLTDILKKEWGHEGFVVSDWGAVNEADESIKSGLGLSMPSDNGEGSKKIIAAVMGGKLPLEVLDASLERLLTVIMKAVELQQADAVYDKEAHHLLAREVARETMVLLKNNGDILPLSKNGSIAVIGELAEKVRFQGGGSSHIKPTKLDNIVKELKAVAGAEADIQYVQGYDLSSDEENEALAEEASKLAAQADVAVLFLGLPERYESEGFDRKHLNLPANQVELLKKISSVQPRVVVVLSNGAPVVMPWLEHTQAVLEAYLGGQAAGGAIADLLFGEANPSGKLAETFPHSLKHNPSSLFFPGDGDRVEYREGIFVGYRYYDAKDIEPLFPFGYGLSYTSFEYSDLVVDKSECKDDETVQVQVKVKNTGSRFGKEIVQLYVTDKESSVTRPEKELKDFAKVALQPGEEKTVVFTLNKRSFAYYNVDLKDWHVESGEFGILIGRSSRDIMLQTSVQVVSTTELVPVFHRNSTLGDIMANPKTLPVLAMLQSMAPKEEDMQPSSAVSQEMMQASMQYMPIRALIPFSNGAMTEDTLGYLLQQLNNAVKA